MGKKILIYVLIYLNYLDCPFGCGSDCDLSPARPYCKTCIKGFKQFVDDTQQSTGICIMDCSINGLTGCVEG